MATKADFADEEWQVLRWAVIDTMAYVSMSEKGFWDTIKEAKGAAKYMADAKANSASLLVRDLAGDVKSQMDKEATSNPTTMAVEVAERITEAATIVAEKAADELDAFKAFILGMARATAEAADGVADSEGTAIANIKAALG